MRPLPPILRKRRMNPDQLELVADVVKAYVSNNAVPRSELPAVIADVSRAFSSLGAAVVEAAPEIRPAVNPKRSVFPDYILSLENGKQFRSLKRHLSALGMTPQQYREKWSLPRDYPMVAESYAAKRSALAKQIGLGRKAAVKAPAEEVAVSAPVQPAKPSEAPAKTPRKARAKKTLPVEA